MKKIPPISVWPLMIWYIFFLLGPILILLVYSFLKRGAYGQVLFQFNIDNYLRLFNPVYIEIFLDTLQLALITTIGCVILGYPIAFVIVKGGKKLGQILLFAITLPFLTNLLVKAFAIKAMLGASGPINYLLLKYNFVAEPMTFTNSYLAVCLAMISSYLPFMVFPIYVVFEKFDFSLLHAAHDLGANRIQAFIKVQLPLTMAGVVTGSLLVFIPALGEFVIPDMFGGAKSMLVGNLIAEQFLKTRDWPFGSALSCTLLCFMLAGYYLKNKFTRVESTY